MTRMDNEKFKNGNYKIENRLKASDKKWEKMKGAAVKKTLEKGKGFETKADWRNRQTEHFKKHGKYDSRTTMEAQENK